MFEIEMKFPVDDFARFRERLQQWQAAHLETRTDRDHYFNAPDRDFAETDEAFRLRSMGERNVITYKGPKIDQQTKTRKEIELPLGDGTAVATKFEDLVQLLGFRSVAVVQKHREIFEFEREGFSLEICFDDVEGLGKFIELEISGSEEVLDAAREVLQRTAAELQLSQGERRSYLQLLLERRPNAEKSI